MSLFGYDPLKYHTGRAPLEAAAQGIELGPDDWAIRCNFVTTENGVMKSFTAGQIPSDLARRLIDAAVGTWDLGYAQKLLETGLVKFGGTW